MEVPPPIKKAAVVYHIPNSGSATKNTSTEKATKKIERKRYSYLRKVIAPYIIKI